ncbi:MAG: hypothetical protein HY553_11960 [Elusimicrobia bacterium]|nr:hypothetical protein [Elusimicrobiota bacterium]
MKASAGGVVLVLALAAGVAARVAGLWTDFWLDEIWNWNIARGHGYADILLRVPYDANHILNTLWLRAVGVREWWGVYRLHSLAAGLATLWLLWKIAVRWGRLEGALAAALGAASFLLTLYSSEARGHTTMVAFALAAFVALESWLRGRSPAAYAAWAASVVLGFFSHLMFAQAYAGLLLWSLWRLRRAPGGLAALHAPGAAAAAFLYVVQVRGMGHAGGLAEPTRLILRDTLALATGAPDSPLAWAAGAAFLAAAAWAARDLRRGGRDEWSFFAWIVFGAPAILLALHPPGLLFPRYFLLAGTFALPLCARAAAVAWRAGGAARGAAAAAVGLFVLGNAVRTASFLKDGRGHYLEALRFMAASSGGREITVGSGHDFAHRMMVSFYAPRVPEASFRYVPREGWTPGSPEWVIGHAERHTPDSPPELTAHNGSRYRLERTYRYSAVSGWDWRLYRRVTSTSEP